MIEQLFNYGEDIAGLAELENDWVLWKNIDVVNLDFVENGKKIAFI